jgi:flagellar biosynthetic protein FliR
MTGEALALFDQARSGLLIAAVVFLRVGAVMALLPGFGERLLPGRIRLGLAIAFTTIVAPAVGARLPAPPSDVAGCGFLLAAETLNGLALGFVLRLFVLAAEMAGTLAAQSGSLSQMFGTAGEPMPAVSRLLILGALATALAAGLHVRAVDALIRSYEAMPAGRFPGAELIRDWSVAQVGAAFGLAFRLAAPFVVAALIYNVALGVINRAMPALMVSFVGAPALSGGALLLLAVAAPLMLDLWQREFAAFLADPFRVAR